MRVMNALGNLLMKAGFWLTWRFPSPEERALRAIFGDEAAPFRIRRKDT